jgi:AraC-like DNA-binding protein
MQHLNFYTKPPVPFANNFSHQATVANSNESFMETLCAFINENIDCHLSVEFVARKMALSKSTLNRRLAQYAGLSANEIIKQCRLQKAAELLLAGKNVSETAYLTGFETPSYFIQCFREFFKQTPKKYSQVLRGFYPLPDTGGWPWNYQFKTA